MVIITDFTRLVIALKLIVEEDSKCLIFEVLCGKQNSMNDTKYSCGEFLLMLYLREIS